ASVPELMKRPGFLVHRAGDPLGHREEAGLIGDLHGELAADRDGLESLRAHHGAHARSARDFVQLVGDAGKAHEIFAGRPDLSDADTRVAQLGENRVLDLAGDLAPEVSGVAEFDGAVVDPEIDRRRGDPVEDDRIPAGALELSAPVASGLRFAEASVERRLGADAVASGAGDRRAREDAGRDDEDVFRTKRIGALGHVLEQIVRDEPAPTSVASEEGVAGLLDPRGAVGEVDVQDLVPEAIAFHQTPPSIYVVASPAAPPSVRFKSLISAPSCSRASRSAC